MSHTHLGTHKHAFAHNKWLTHAPTRTEHTGRETDKKFGMEKKNLVSEIITIMWMLNQISCANCVALHD